MLKPEGISMHPLPRRPKIDPEEDAVPRAMEWSQERNGMWMRAAVLLKIYNLESRIQDLDQVAFAALDASS